MLFFARKTLFVLKIFKLSYFPYHLFFLMSVEYREELKKYKLFDIWRSKDGLILILVQSLEYFEINFHGKKMQKMCTRN